MGLVNLVVMPMFAVWCFLWLSVVSLLPLPGEVIIGLFVRLSAHPFVNSVTQKVMRILLKFSHNVHICRIEKQVN